MVEIHYCTYQALCDCCSFGNPFYSDNLQTYYLVNSEDLDEMPHKGMHYLLRPKQSSATERHYNLKIMNFGPFECKMDTYSLHHYNVCKENIRMK